MYGRLRELARLTINTGSAKYTLSNEFVVFDNGDNCIQITAVLCDIQILTEVRTYPAKSRGISSDT